MTRPLILAALALLAGCTPTPYWRPLRCHELCHFEKGREEDCTYFTVDIGILPNGKMVAREPR